MPRTDDNDQIDWVAVAKRRVVVSVGQLTPADCRKLDRAVRAGDLTKWRGCWFPVGGAPEASQPSMRMWARLRAAFDALMTDV